MNAIETALFATLDPQYVTLQEAVKLIKKSDFQVNISYRDLVTALRKEGAILNKGTKPRGAYNGDLFCKLHSVTTESGKRTTCINELTIEFLAVWFAIATKQPVYTDLSDILAL